MVLKMTFKISLQMLLPNHHLLQIVGKVITGGADVVVVAIPIVVEDSLTIEILHPMNSPAHQTIDLPVKFAIA